MAPLRCFLVALLLSAEAVQADDKPVYRVLGNDKGKVALINSKGDVEWEYPTRFDGHDLWLLPNGNVLLPTGPATVAEVTPDKKIVWQYEARARTGYKGRVEVHAFQRLAEGLTMIAESGNRRIVEVDKEGKLVHENPLTIDKPDARRGCVYFADFFANASTSAAALVGVPGFPRKPRSLNQSM
jgi:hypothetical protein